MSLPGRQPLKLLPTVAVAETRHFQDGVLDLAQRLRAVGWQINVAFESADDGERFSLTGARAP